MRARIAILTSLLFLLGAAATSSGPRITDVWALMADMRAESHRDALTIKEVYAGRVESSSFENVDHLRRALESGELVPFENTERFNMRPRLGGQSFIGSLDLDNQMLYVTARPAAIGMLFEIGKQLRSGPVEITSLVRTADYQRKLMRGNGNANTDVPTHVMGYAVDIGVKDMPIETALELRAILEKMREAGDIYFIGERNQLTFHVVPVPSRIDYFEQAYRTAIEEQQVSANPPEPMPPQPATPEAPRGALDRVWAWLTSLIH
jgi:hypothetical protein